jgi:hypothetical protein
LLDAYVSVAGWDASTEESNLGYIRRTIKPALGTKEVRKVRGPLLDNLYARLQKCGDPPGARRATLAQASRSAGFSVQLARASVK